MVYTLEEVARGKRLSPDGLAFCRTLLMQGEVLAVRLNYHPESLVWLVSTATQARQLQPQAPNDLILTLAEAQDLLTAAGSPWPASLWEVAASLVAPAPDGQDRTDQPGATEPDPEDGWPVP